MENTRKQFLKQLFISATAVLVLIEACKKSDTTDVDTTSSGSCTVSPEETDGPYPLFASRGSSIRRVDITDGKTGTPLHITINVLNTNNNCKPLANARVDIWHARYMGYTHGNIQLPFERHQFKIISSSIHDRQQHKVAILYDLSLIHI